MFMGFSLLPREMKFFDMFDDAAKILTRAGGKFLDMVTQFDRLEARSTEIRQEEHACDEVIGQIMKALDRSFITPFDREDIHMLAAAFDDIMDNLEETTHRFEVFRIDKVTPEAISLARIVHECCIHLEHAVRLLRSMKNAKKVQNHLKEITRLENEADQIYRKTDADLFVQPPDILTLIKWRELYGWLEETVDACKQVATIITGIIIKGT